MTERSFCSFLCMVTLTFDLLSVCKVTIKRTDLTHALICSMLNLLYVDLPQDLFSNKKGLEAELALLKISKLTEFFLKLFS